MDTINWYDRDVLYRTEREPYIYDGIDYYFASIDNPNDIFVGQIKVDSTKAELIRNGEVIAGGASILTNYLIAPII